MNGNIPDFIARQYGSRAKFKSVKRQQVRAVERAIAELTLGCAHLPLGSEPVSAMKRICLDLKKALSIEEWGR